MADVNQLTQQTIKAVAEPKEIFVFGAMDTTNQPALPAFTQKELFGFGAGSSASQSTPTGPKPGERQGEAFPPRLPAVLLWTVLMGHRPAGANSRNNKCKQRRHDRKVILGGTRVRAKYSRWWISQRRGRDRTLDQKGTAISAAKGAAQITLKTQSMIPDPRRTKQTQEPWLLIMEI